MLVEEFMKRKKNLDYGDLVESLGAVAVRPHGKNWPTHKPNEDPQPKPVAQYNGPPKFNVSRRASGLCFWPSGLVLVIIDH